MKQASPQWVTQVFEGREATVTEHRGQPIDPAAWYVGNAAGSVYEGPFRDERRAVREVYAMANTSGT